MAKCKRHRVKFRIKSGKGRGKTVEFMGRQGTGCPKPKRSTAHLREYKSIMKQASPFCARKTSSRAAFRKCVSNAFRSARPR